MRQIWIGFAAGTKDILPAFDGSMHGGVETDFDYAVGIIGKHNVTSARRWKQGLCQELRELGLWASFWWAN